MVTATEVSLALLGRCSFFDGLTKEDRRWVLSRARERRVKKGQEFFAQGERPCALHLLVSGEVKLLQSGPDGQEVIVRLVGPGEPFAWTAALEESTYPATARAVRASHALLWDTSEVADMLQRFPVIGRNALRMLLARTRELEERVREMATERVAQRIARTLLRLASHAGKKLADGVLIDLPLSREDLARMAGTTVFTVSRTLSEWEEKGILRTERRQVVILRPHGLVAIAENLGAPGDGPGAGAARGPRLTRPTRKPD